MWTSAHSPGTTPQGWGLGGGSRLPRGLLRGHRPLLQSLSLVSWHRETWGGGQVCPGLGRPPVSWELSETPGPLDVISESEHAFSPTFQKVQPPELRIPLSAGVKSLPSVPHRLQLFPWSLPGPRPGLPHRGSLREPFCPAGCSGRCRVRGWGLPALAPFPDVCVLPIGQSVTGGMSGTKSLQRR